MRYFKWSFILSLLGLIAAYFWGGIAGVSLALILSVLEISLSFDNAVINASILKETNRRWQKRFLTWGILIAVFGMRLLFPILIVTCIAQLTFIEVALMAFKNPKLFSEHLIASDVSISAFGGMFLLLVFLSFLFNQKKNIHWLTFIEKKLKMIGKIESIESVIALITLLIFIEFIPEAKKLPALTAGVIGIIVFILLNSLSDLLSKLGKILGNNKDGLHAAKRTGIMSFLYLEVLDACFSFDGVIAAFAITKDIVIIMIGLAIGALFVRTLTVFLVQKNTLQRFLYLEHGAHYAIGALAVIMLINMNTHISEIVTGLIGILFIGLAIISSILRRSK